MSCSPSLATPAPSPPDPIPPVAADDHPSQLWPAGTSWRGRWIWDRLPDLQSPGLVTRAGTEAAPPAWVLMRRSFHLDRVPRRAPARFTSDSRHRLSVNGEVVARGPVRSHPSRLHHDQMDLAPVLRRGENVIAVTVRFYGRPTPWWAPARPTRHLGAGGFLFEAFLTPGDRRETDDPAESRWVVSDDSWKVWSAGAWTERPSPGIGGPPEVLDARLLPGGWTEVGFDDSGWATATVLPANHFGFDGDHSPPTLPYGPLLRRPIAQLGGRTLSPTQEGPWQLEPGEQTLSMDFGRVVSGTLALEVDAPEGTEFHVSFGEGVETVAGSGEESELVSYVAPGGRARFESFDPLGFRHVQIRVRSSAGAAVTALEVGERLHPRGPGARFSSNDRLLDRIWEVGRRTVDLCSHDAYIDCPTREQRAWVGDAATTLSVDLVSNTNWDLARWNTELLASPRPDGMLPMAAGGDFEYLDFTYIPDFALHWIHALEILRRYTGDRDLIGRLLPVAERVMGWFEDFVGPDGLLNQVTGWVFIDWAAVSTAGRGAALNGLWGRALLDLAAVAGWLGASAVRDRARRAHRRLRTGFEAFWDPDRRLYVDHITADGPQVPTSQHAQAAALAGRLVPWRRMALLVPHLLESKRLVDTYWGDLPIGGPPLREGPPEPHWDVAAQMVKAQPGFRPVVHDALVCAGRPDLIPRACRDWALLLRRCDTTFGETWTAGTTCHAWSSIPTRDLIVRTAGVIPAEPGFARVAVTPCPGDLKWIEAVTPCPAGLIAVSIRSGQVIIDSPVPVRFDPTWLWSGPTLELDPGRHVITPDGPRPGEPPPGS